VNEGPFSRRAFTLTLAKAAGVAPFVLGILEGRGEALPRGEETDLSILYAALALEHAAIAVYEHGLKKRLFPPGLKNYAVEFRGDHLGHRDTQIAIAEERGGHPPQPPPEGAWSSVATPDELLRTALAAETAAQDAYASLVGQIGTPDYLLSAAFILVDEVRHMTVWRRVLGLKIY
jgi:hypothetical protein